MRTREEHLQWCKDRALEYYNDGELLNAVTSMMSDLKKHPDTAKLAEGVLAALGLVAASQAQAGNAKLVRDYIVGFH